MEKYYKNFVLCGELNYFCLLCQENFMNTNDAEKHLIWNEHKEIVKKQEFIPKLRKDFIYKVPCSRYYCAICNEVFKKIDDHIIKKTHQDFKKSNTSKKKRVQVAQYVNKFTVQILNENITLAKWHGIVDDKCLLCDEPFVRLVQHITSHNHVVRLIECETILENGNPYRKQGINSFYCFNCFKKYDEDTLAAHWTECRYNTQKKREEKENVKTACRQTSKENQNTATIKRKLKNSNIDNSRQPVCVPCNQVLDLNYDALEIHVQKHIKENTLNTFRVYYTDKGRRRAHLKKKAGMKYFNFDTSNKAECLKCKKVITINSGAIESHIRRHERRQILDCEGYLIDKGKRRAELADYGSRNCIKLNRGGSMGYCVLCYVYISAHIKNAREHVKGSLHMGHLELRGFVQKRKHEHLPCKVIPLQKFIDVIRGPFTLNQSYLVFINNNICLTSMSFMLISQHYYFNDRTFKCYCCNIIGSVFGMKEHTEIPEHERNVCFAAVLLLSKNDDVEFIRQILPNLYHCGYCNKVFPFWENLKKHLEDFSHRENKIKAKIFSYQAREMFKETPQNLSDELVYKKK